MEKQSLTQQTAQRLYGRIVTEGGLAPGDKLPNELDLSRELWYAYEDNFGTSEEKALVAAIHAHIRELQAAYDAVYLVRNERQLSLYAFADGARFEPDFLLFLLKRQDGGWVQTQVCLDAENAVTAADYLLHLERQPVWAEETCGSLRCRVCGLRPRSFWSRRARTSCRRTPGRSGSSSSWRRRPFR